MINNRRTDTKIQNNDNLYEFEVIFLNRNVSNIKAFT